MIIEADTILSILSMTELDYKNKKLVETNVSKIQYHSHRIPMKTKWRTVPRSVNIIIKTLIGQYSPQDEWG